MLRGSVLAICLIPALAFAETVWVNDIIYLGVRPQLDGGKPVAVVKSGTLLEVLERQKRNLKVRTPDGVEGWVSTTYVSETLPARQRLAQLEERHAQLNREMERVNAETAKINDANTKLSANLLAMTEERDQLQQKVAELKAEVEALRPKPESGEPDYTLHYAAGGVALLALVAFGAGARWYRGKVIKRLGGLRI